MAGIMSHSYLFRVRILLAVRFILVITAPFVFPFAPLSAETIRVAIAGHQKSVTIRSSGGLEFGQRSRAAIIKKKTFTSAAVGRLPVRIRSRSDSITVNGTEFRGLIELRNISNRSILVINEVDLEEYLMGVVAAEIPPKWEFEALKAQAVASRTYALHKKKTSEGQPYHLSATKLSQIYGGKRSEHDNAIKAVQETAGLILTYQGEVIPTYYHSSCGGHTEDARELWGVDAPYLRGVDCDCQEISPYGAWQRNLKMTAVNRVLMKAGYRVGTISDISLGLITPAGRVRELIFRHSGGVTRVPGETFRAAIGYDVVPSIFLDVSVSRDELVLFGRGRGHGIGLCQWGAKEMARRGHDFRSILQYYYPGTRMIRMEELSGAVSTSQLRDY